MNAEILRGYTEAIILNILNKRDSYGYFITKTIMERVDNKIDIKNATIYLAFKRMEKESLISSYWEEGEHGVRRKQYSITDKGREYLKLKKFEWKNNKVMLDKLLGDK